jgi:hypothetical protein
MDIPTNCVTSIGQANQNKTIDYTFHIMYGNTHTYAHGHTHAVIRSHTHTDIHTHTHTHTHTHIHTHIHTHTNSVILSHTHTHTHTYPHTHTHTQIRTHTYPHTLFPVNYESLLVIYRICQRLLVSTTYWFFQMEAQPHSKGDSAFSLGQVLCV